MLATAAYSQFLLPTFAYPSKAYDEQLKPSEKKATLQRILRLLPEIRPFLKSSNVGEIFYLKERIRRLAGNNHPQEKVCEEILQKLHAQASKATTTQCDEEFVLKMSQLSLEESEQRSNPFLLTPVCIELMASYMSSPTDKISPLRMSFAMLVPLTSPQTSGRNFMCALRISELFRTYSLKEYESVFITDLQKHGIDAEQLKAHAGTDPCDLPTVQRFLNYLSESIKKQCPTSMTVDNITSQFGKIAWHAYMEGVATHLRMDTQTLYNTTEEIVLRQPHLLVLLNDKALLMSMIASGLNVNQVDAQGYTFSHFAAMFRQWTTLALLHLLGANFEQKCCTQASVYDLLKAQGFAVRKESRSFVFKQMYKRSRSSHLDASSEALFTLWSHKAQAVVLATLPIFERNVIESFYQQRKENKIADPPFYACQKKLENGSTWEVRASRKIAAGSFIAAFAGRLKAPFEVKERLRDVKHLCKTPFEVFIDTSEVTNLTDLMQRGPPICDFITFIRDGRVQVLVYSLQDIEKDQLITYDDGAERKQGALEYAPQHIDAFIRDTRELTYFHYEVTKQQHYYQIHYLEMRKDLFVRDSYTVPNGSQAIESIAKLQVRYERLMLHYLYAYPEHLFELLHQKKLAPGRLYSFFEAYRELFAKLIDEQRHNELIARILVESSRKGESRRSKC